MTEETKQPEQQSSVPAPISRANAPLVAGQGIVPRTLEELYRVAVAFCASGLMPKGMNRPEQVMVACQMGMEMGLTMMQSVQNIAVINGRPSIWGDLPLALVRKSGLLEYLHEDITGEADSLVATCTAKRKGVDEIVRTWTWADAVRAKLSTKDVWQNYPKRMCQMRARGWALKDLFPDVIRGISIAEYDAHGPAGPIDAGEPGEVVPQIAAPSIEEMMGEAPQAAAAPPEIAPPDPDPSAKTTAADIMQDPPPPGFEPDAKAETPPDEVREDVLNADGLKPVGDGDTLDSEALTTQARNQYMAAVKGLGLNRAWEQIIFRWTQHQIEELGMDPADVYTRGAANIQEHAENAAKHAKVVWPPGATPNQAKAKAAAKKAAPKQAPAATGDPLSSPEAELAWKKTWINLRKGYKAFVLENLGLFARCSAKTRMRAAKKWRMQVEGAAWPVTEEMVAAARNDTPQETQIGAPDSQAGQNGTEAAQGDADLAPEKNGQNTANGEAEDVDIFETTQWQQLVSLYDKHPEAYNKARADLGVNPSTLTIPIMQQMIERIEAEVQQF